VNYLEKMTCVDAIAAIVLGTPIAVGMIWAGMSILETRCIECLMPFLILL
jgi:hypothetical protein